MDRNGKHSKINVNRRQNWQTTQRRDWSCGSRCYVWTYAGSRRRSEGQKDWVIAIEDAKVIMQVGISLHLDPPMVHTVHIEPLTPADWESKCFLR